MKRCPDCDAPWPEGLVELGPLAVCRCLTDAADYQRMLEGERWLLCMNGHAELQVKDECSPCPECDAPREPFVAASAVDAIWDARRAVERQEEEVL